MSETKWGPGPWRRGEEHETKIEIIDAEGRPIATFYSWGLGWRATDEMDARAVRALACVNACAGIPTEALEAGALAGALDHATDILQHVESECEESDCETRLGLIATLRALGRLK